MRVTIALLALASAQVGHASTFALRGRVLPITAPVIEDGVVIVEDGRITAVGPAREVSIPPGASVIAEPSGWIVPGFVDLHDHVAGTDLNDSILPVNPDLSVLEQITPGNEELLDALAGGVTTVLFLPGSSTNLGGFGALLKVAGRDPQEMLLRYPGAMKIAQAGNPERRSGEIGSGRMGMNWNLREELRAGLAHHRAWEDFEAGRRAEPPPRTLRLDTMRGLFRHEFPVLVHTQWAPVFQSTIRMLVDEFGLWIVMSHAEFDSFHNAPLVVERDLPVNVGPRAYHVDYDDGRVIGLAAQYHEAGVQRLSICTDSPVVPQEELSFQAALAVRLGLPWVRALEAITIEPARAIGIADRAGSLEVGKDGDVVMWTGDPLDPRSSVLAVISCGRLALDQRAGAVGERRW